MGAGASSKEEEDAGEAEDGEQVRVNHLQELRSGALAPVDLTPNQALLHAAEHGDLDGIRLQLRNGADVNWSDQGPVGGKKDDPLYKNAIVTGDFALHRAAQYGQLEAVDLIFLSDAKMENKDRLGSTALHRAVSHGQLEVVKRLLALDADHMARNIIGNTPLHIAAYLGNVEICRVLLEHEKHSPHRMIVAKNAVDMTPLDYAKKRAVAELFDAVMKRGESVSAVHPRIDRASGDSKSRKDRDWPILIGRLEKEQQQREKEKETGRLESKERDAKDGSAVSTQRRERGLSSGPSMGAVKSDAKLSPPLAANMLMSSLSGPYASTSGQHTVKDKQLPATKSHVSIGTASDRDVP